MHSAGTPTAATPWLQGQPLQRDAEQTASLQSSVVVLDPADLVLHHLPSCPCTPFGSARGWPAKRSPAAGLKAEQLLSMLQAKGSGYAMSTEDELESIRQMALQTAGLGPLPSAVQGKAGARQYCTAQGGGGTAQYCTVQGEVALHRVEVALHCIALHRVEVALHCIALHKVQAALQTGGLGLYRWHCSWAVCMSRRLPDLLRLPALTQCKTAAHLQSGPRDGSCCVKGSRASRHMVYETCMPLQQPCACAAVFLGCL